MLLTNQTPAIRQLGYLGNFVIWNLASHARISDWHVPKNLLGFVSVLFKLLGGHAFSWIGSPGAGTAIQAPFGNKFFHPLTCKITLVD